jgi:hypothetical protein
MQRAKVKIQLILFVLSFFSAVLPVEAGTTERQLKDLPIGAVIYDPDSIWEYRTENDHESENNPIEWIIIAKNHYTTDPDVDSVTLITKEVIAKYPFDKIGADKSINWGNSRQIRPWLNGNFLNHLSQEFKENILTTIVPNIDWETNASYTTYDKVFIPSHTEIGFKGYHSVGADWKFFSDEKSNRVAKLAGNEQSYWTRSPVTGGSVALFYVTDIGGAGIVPGMFMHRDDGVRPVINMRADSLVQCVDEGDLSDFSQKQPKQLSQQSVPSNWAVADIEAAKEYGIITDKILSDYQKPITREEFCELAIKLFQAFSDREVIPAPEHTFKDTNNPDVLKAYYLGIVGGVGEGLFTPQSYVNREQISVMLYNTIKAIRPNLEAPSDLPPKFGDSAEISSWAIDSVKDITARGIIGGVEGNRFNPKGTVTREQTIVQFKRIYEQLQQENNSKQIYESSVKEFYLDQEGPIFLSVGEAKQISATVMGTNLSFDEEYPRWGISNISIATITGSVLSGYTNTFAGITERYIVTADKEVYVNAISPGQVTLSITIGPYPDANHPDKENRSQTKKITVIVRE